MAEQFVRVYQKLEFNTLKEHTLLYGVLSGSCSKCKALNVKLEAHQCPECSTEFKYVAFQNAKQGAPKMKKLSAQRPSLIFVDYDDFKRTEGENRARDILG